MKKSAVIAVLMRLRCTGCKRAPTPEEVGEMYENFGKKLAPGDGPNLRWCCLKCVPS